jgi:MarR family transcriptional regulator, 2-MHQ and catechol-resistance regulon repressor
MPTHFTGPEAQALDTFIKLMRASDAVMHQVVRQIRTIGLTEPQFAVLEILFHRGPMHQNVLSTKQLVSGGNMSVVLDNLEKRELIRRETDAADRRCTIIYLTAAGQKLIQDYFPAHAVFIKKLFSALNADEQRQLAILTRKLGLAVHGREPDEK